MIIAVGFGTKGDLIVIDSNSFELKCFNICKYVYNSINFLEISGNKILMGFDITNKLPIRNGVFDLFKQRKQVIKEAEIDNNGIVKLLPTEFTRD